MPRQHNRQTIPSATQANQSRVASGRREALHDEFDEGTLGDDDLFATCEIRLPQRSTVQLTLVIVEDLEYSHIDRYDNLSSWEPLGDVSANDGTHSTNTRSLGSTPSPRRQLQDGKWTCNHRCKDKTA